jgi:hypothetical protein
MDELEMPLDDLVAACRVETAKFLRGEPSRDDYCRELFRRAVCEQDQAAWQLLFEQYRRQIIAWVRQHPASASLDEDDEVWVNAAFERFFVSIGPARFDIFTDLGQILRYLKLCCHSAVMDEARARARARHQPISEHEPARGPTANPERATADDEVSRAIWEIVLGSCRSAAERIIARELWMLGMKPAEIYARHPDVFAAVKEVYTSRRNLADRLGRDPRFAKFWDLFE